jgi:tryptophan-rich sensory protein
MSKAGFCLRASCGKKIISLRDSFSISNANLNSSSSSSSSSSGLGYSHCGFHSGSSLRSHKIASLSELLQFKQSVYVRKASLQTVGARAAAAAAAASPGASNDGITSLIVAVGTPLVLGIIDAVINNPSTQWYKDLKKPRWQPPSFLFGGAWSILYPLMGLASWLVWAEGGWAKQSYPLTLYGIQLALNLLWPALFFGIRNLGLALVDIVALAAAIIATLLAFKPVNEIAANLLKPYLAWVLFATALNYKLWELNKQGSPSTQPAAAPQQQY